MKPKNANEYICLFPMEVRERLEILHNAIQQAAPLSEEVISYGMPAYKQNGVLVYMAAYKNHIGFYPTPSAVKAFSKRLTKYKTAKGSIKFPLEKPLPLGLIRKITQFRVKESRKLDGRWKN